MNSVKIKELDTLFILRHAQRCDKIATTISSIDFVQKPNEYIITDSFNPGLATFQSTNNKSNNGYTQSLEMGSKLLTYIEDQVKESTIVLKFHTSPYLRCVQTIKFMIDYLVKRHRQKKLIKVIITIDQVLSEWLNTELDMNYYPPNDNGATLLGSAVQYLNSNLQFNRNENVKIEVDLKDSYKHGNPGPYSESFIQQHSRISQGLISIIKDDVKNLSFDPNFKDIILIMTHGAAVRSLISKLTGRSLYVEIPLASMSIAKSIALKGKHYYWKLLETDIELQNRFNFQQVDIYSTKYPYQDYQTTFGSNCQTSQLNFKDQIFIPKTDNFNKIKSQFLLNPRNRNYSDDSDDDSENEGLTFNVTSTNHLFNHDLDQDRQKRYRSTSLFGPVLNNPFSNDFISKSLESKNFKKQKNLIQKEEEIISSIQNINKLSSSSSLISTISHTNHSYQNLDPDDGVCEMSNEKVPDLAEISSNNSSTNSLHGDLTIFPGTLSKLSSPEPTITITNEFNEITTVTGESSTSSTSSTKTSATTTTSFQDETLKQKSSNASMETYHPNNKSSSIFDKAAIEESLNEIIRKPQKDDEAPSSNWITFSRPNNALNSNTPITNLTNKLKLTFDLYSEKNKCKTLDIYGDSSDNSSNGGWFLGSNKY